MDSNKSLLKNGRFWSVIVLLIILIFGGKSWYNNRAIDPTKDINITFAGKNGSGYIKNLDQYYSKVSDNIDKAFARKDGISNSDLKAIQHSRSIPKKLTSKAKLFHAQKKSMTVKFSKTKNLKNNEVIQIIVNSKMANIPVKHINRDITVSGL